MTFRVGIFIAAGAMSIGLAGCVAPAGNHGNHNGGGPGKPGPTDSNGKPVVTKSLKPVDRQALTTIIAKMRKNRDAIEKRADSDSGTGEDQLDKAHIVDTINYAGDFADREVHLLSKFDELTGWDDSSTIAALKQWDSVSVTPILLRSQPYACGNWSEGDCRNDMAIPIENQIRKLHPISEHGFQRMEKYLQSTS